MLDHVTDEVIADGISVPVSPRQQVLHPIWRVLRQLPAVLALGVTEQPLNVPDGALRGWERRKC
jgi:hypothetical protein